MRSTSSLFPINHLEANETTDNVAESWNIRTVLSNWTWRLIAELKDDG